MSYPPPLGPDVPESATGSIEPTPLPWYRRRLTRISAVLAAILAYPVTKIVIGLVTASLASQAVSGLYGGAWDRLPSEVRTNLESRLDGAYGDALDGLPESAVSERVASDVRNGMRRLDDESLVQRMLLQATALHAVSEADCAAFGRTSLAGRLPSDTTSQHFADVLSTNDFQSFVEIAVAAIEAELRDRPAVRTVSPDREQHASDAVFTMLSPPELELVVEASTNTSATDAVVCSAIRTIYDAVLKSDSTDLATLALIDVSPPAQ